MEKNNYTAAIDLGTSNVVVAVGTPGTDGRVHLEGVVVKESKGVVRGEVRNADQAAASIREAVSEIEQRLGVKITEAYTGLSGSHIRCAKHPYYVYVAGKDGEIFPEDVRKLNESMQSVKAPDGYELLHIVPQHYVVDEEEEVPDPVGMFGKTLGSTFCLIIGDNNISSRLEKALFKTGIRQKKLVINPLAAAEAVTFPDEKELGVAVVDLGAGTTDICVYHDGIVRYVGVIPLGAESINKDIRSYGIMERYVEELKIKYGCAVSANAEADKLVKVPGRTPHDHKEISFRNLAAIMEARLTDIAEYVKEEIRASGFEGKLAAGIILTGGSSLIPCVKELFEEKTGLEVRIAVPEIVADADSAATAQDPRAAAALGILYTAIEEGGGEGVKYVGVKTPPADNAVNGVPAGTRTQDSAPQPPRQQTRERREVEPDPIPDDPFAETEPRREKGPKKGIFSKLWGKIEKTLDFEVLDDENENY